MNQVLLISYFYSPIENPGTRRVEAFVKYLPESGYRSVVLTTNARGSMPNDDKRLIFRADDLMNIPARPYRSFKLKQLPVELRANTWAVSPDGNLTRFLQAFLAPDIHITWYPLAVMHARQLLRAQSIQLLYSSSPPETNHLVALRLKRETGLPWVADFRDGWMFEPLNQFRLSIAPRRRLEGYLERQVVQAADRIITINASMAENLARRYPKAGAKISIITNGYDPDDFARLSRQPSTEGKFRIVYTGALALSRSGTSITGLLDALRAMRDTDLLHEIEIVLVGQLAANESHAIKHAGLGGIITITGPVAHQQALQHQINADVLLLVTVPGATGISTSKLFEYLATGRPILALTGQSPAATLITDLGAGVIVQPDDAVGIQAALQKLYIQWKAGTLPSHVHEGTRRFNRRELTKDLAHLFDTLR